MRAMGEGRAGIEMEGSIIRTGSDETRKQETGVVSRFSDLDCLIKKVNLSH